MDVSQQDGLGSTVDNTGGGGSSAWATPKKITDDPTMVVNTTMMAVRGVTPP
jgi:hypothetical protein